VTKDYYSEKTKILRRNLMKYFILLPIAVGILTFMGHNLAARQEAFPNTSVGLDACLAEARSQPAKERCEALESCQADESNNREDLQQCQFKAEQNYLKGLNKTPVESFIEDASSVRTDPADSNYLEQGDNHKGWRQSRQP
jgi:hypothetical protein